MSTKKDGITEIKEQYLLLDLGLAFSIADEMGITYPRDAKSDTPYILKMRSPQGGSVKGDRIYPP